ncbi:MAG: succinate--CoA ligase subunit alpha [bacterium JZ-2024 1]
MGILVGEKTRVLVHGITGREGAFHTRQMLDYGTHIVGGVTPGKGGQTVEGLPVFNTVAEALKQVDANASVLFVPPASAADSAMEAMANGISVVVVITEGVPVHDAVLIAQEAHRRGVTLIGPNTPGICTPVSCKIGIMPNTVFRTSGNVGVISRSGTLTYEVVDRIVIRGLGISTAVGVGGDPVPGSTFADLIPAFEKDPQTEALVLIGEIGGTDEERAAALLKQMPKLGGKSVAFVSGRTAPPGKRMGHAGAIISGGLGTADSKVAAFQDAGIPVPLTLDDLIETLLRVIRA